MISMRRKRHAGQPSGNPDLAGRFEFKYRISYFEYLRLRAAIVPHMSADPYARQAPGGRYFVRSLYFDTLNRRVYDEKLAGDTDRVKYRLRAYHPDPDQASVVKVELKVRRGESLAKYATGVPVEQARAFLRERNWAVPDNPVLVEFDRNLHSKGLVPTVLIDYLREGYESRYRDGIRLTFDHQVQSTHATELFPSRTPFFRIHHPHEVVLEIKCRDYSPRWLASLVQAHGLRLVANSKYTQAVEAARHDQAHVDGIVIVR